MPRSTDPLSVVGTLNSEGYRTISLICDYARPNEYAPLHKHVLLHRGLNTCMACGRTWEPGSESRFVEAPDA